MNRAGRRRPVKAGWRFIDEFRPRMRPTSHVATAQPAPVKNPTQNQTIISSRLTFVGI